MFKHILIYELKYWLKKPAFYLYLTIFSAIAFLSIIGTAGLFDPPPPSNTIERLVNSPFEINYMLQYFCKILLFLLPAIIGATIYKDYKSNAHSVLYSFPIRKKDYLLGKFLSGFLLICFISLSVGFAMLIAEHIPGLHITKIGIFEPTAYLQALFVFIIPNLLFFGMIVFAVVAYFRNIYAGFVAIIILFFLQNIIENAFNGISIALFDPFGQNAVLYETQSWTLTDKNTKFIPIFGVVLYNRLIWLSISILAFVYIYRTFAFTEQPITSIFKKKKKSSKIKASIDGLINISLPKVAYDFSSTTQFRYAWLLSKVNFQTIVKSWMFYILIFFGIIAVLFSIAKVTNNSEMTILPSTNIVLTIPAFFFTTIIMLLTFIYSGMLIHRDQTSNMNQLVDATPISNFALLISKVLAIVKMQAVLLTIMMLVGISIQLYNSYYQLEIDLYLFHLFIYQFIGLIVWAFASVFIHTITNNTYIGIFVLILSWLGISGLQQIGISSRLLLFNFAEPFQYSDLNGYANHLQPYFLVKSYWLVFGIILLIFAYLFFGRGIIQSIKERLIQAKASFNGSLKIILSICLTAFVALGFTIYSAESKSQELSSKERNKAFKTFEDNFGHYANLKNQPKIKDIALSIDIFPETNQLFIKGQYLLVNTSSQHIDTLLIKTGFDETTIFKLDRLSEVVDKDSYVKFSVLKFASPLKPNDSLKLDFTIKNKPITLFENNSNVLNNGTFFKNNIFPRIGFFLAQNQKHPSDSLVHQSHYYSQDSDAIKLNTIISTSKEQTAIAPGYLKNQWSEDDRNYYEYATDSKIKNSLSFSSGIYVLEKETYKNIKVEIYHHKNHKHNLSKMKDGLKAALDYNTKYFGPYQFNEARIIEFPITEGTYASVMANSIPTSEMRFIANSSQETVDISFYTIAHELTHQWFGNQIAPANALGATMISESITEYISLNIYQNHHGKGKALQFLKAQHERYQKGRTKESGEEPPLYLAKGDQQYLVYGKGTIAFNALSHYLGKERLHAILRDFLHRYKNKEAYYPTSIDLISALDSQVPDELKYLIEDYFKTVTFHEAKINSVTSKLNEVVVDFEYSKLKNGKPSKINDHVEIGFYNDNDELISIERVLINSKNNQNTFNLKELPAKIVIDPNLLLIEKNKADNTYKF
ncbi:ABC transporter permease/M1 family aminopeptidase [Winogradskyella flava]|uniref:ABC transporter permease/M1 family aminopeptidase n=1 Tax=Winogradskyella flava TaxID=1884876 RepID=UPI0024920EF6|nr:M1 family aminopeptidase [Winogradskyella flava]